ncbi:hypothetical protein N7465_006110 [Penicillium sp. CMV-2018d]|nr:hypothetical protein N7465_006110 [Penicillium sp. CMV-2018d]
MRSPPPPTSATQSPPSPSASGTERSIGQQLVASQGFWGLMIVAARFLAAGAGYLLWRRPTSKGEDLEDASPKDVTVGEQPKDTREEIPAGDDVEAQTPKTPAPSTTPKKKKRLGSAKIASLSTVARNTAHGVREVFSPGQH